MPVRFACPHCRQKLSVSSRKAGREAHCPRCQRLLTIPAVEADRIAPQEPESKHDPLTSSEQAASSAEFVIAPPAADEPQLAFGGAEEFELVFDTTDDAAVNAPEDAHPDWIAVPRLVLYLQGGLLAVVALVSFALGLIAGGAFSGGAAPSAPRACTLEGTINYASGNRNLPDPGAVIAIIPESGQRPQRKAPVSGLRPDDATPDANHHGIAILREIGGGYARTDDRGRFQVRVPDRGKYLVLVISSAREVRDLGDISTADLLKLGPFFDNAAGLLGRQQYRLTSELVRSDRQLNVLFE